MTSIYSTENILKILLYYNEWWQNDIVNENYNKKKKRFPFYEAKKYFLHDSIRRSILLSGARRTGKTTIMYQMIAELIASGVSSKNILFISFEHPIFKLCKIDQVIEVYKNNICSNQNVYFFFDEIQYADDWDVWLKILYDTMPNLHLMATGSASPILYSKVQNESGLGRWKVISVPTLSFFEYCDLLDIEKPNLPIDIKPTMMYKYSIIEQNDIFSKLDYLQPHFLRYLAVGGFPELALSKDDIYAQRVLREDIVDKAIKRDLPQVYGVRNISDLEKVFLYLCYNSSNIISIDTIAKELVCTSRQTISKYIDQLESANLIYVSEPIDVTGKKILKIKNKIYISDAAIKNAVLMNDDYINNFDELGKLVETAVYKHIKSFYYDEPCKVGYYRESNTGKEIDVVVSSSKYTIMIEVKYREKSTIKETDAIVKLYDGKRPNIVITKRNNDFGIDNYNGKLVYRIPASSFLYLLGYVEYNKLNK